MLGSDTAMEKCKQGRDLGSAGGMGWEQSDSQWLEQSRIGDKSRKVKLKEGQAAWPGRLFKGL